MTGQNSRVDTRLVPETMDNDGKAASEPSLNGTVHHDGLDTRQDGLTVVTRIRAGHVDRLKALLKTQLSVGDIRRNAEIRAGLLETQTTDQTRQWLALL